MGNNCKLNIMKYKLIKTYPGSPCLGFITEEKHYIKNSAGDFLRIGITDIYIKELRIGEFWEEVVEKDYEILSYQGKETSNIYSITDDGKYKSGLIQITITNDLILNYYNIHSVKRLNDGEIFTIGEYLKDSNYGKTLIKEITLEESIINPGKFKIKIWSCAECYSTPIKGSNYGFDYIEDVIKFKQPLFTTEDGVDIFEGDTVFQVRKDNYCLQYMSIGNNQTSSEFKATAINTFLNLIFSTKEKAKIDSRNEVNTNVSVLDQQIIEQRKRNELELLKVEQNKIRSSSITSQLLQEQFIEKWDGRTPLYGNTPVTLLKQQ